MSMQKSTKSSRALLAEGRVKVFFDTLARAASPQRRLIASDDGDSAAPRRTRITFIRAWPFFPFTNWNLTLITPLPSLSKGER